jgi:formamidopyrimidine-DNA glycosylase
MPELPEVETVRRQLSAELVGAEIVEVEVRTEKVFEGIPKSIHGEKIAKVNRVGKYLFVYFESGRGLAIHLKMTGRLVIMNYEARIMNHGEFDYETATHTRIRIDLRDGRIIYYWDTRMFGYLHIVERIGEAEEKLKGKMGPEPFEVTDIELLRRLQKTGRTVKEAILDQNLLAGVGNIYANDGLWLSGIDPRRKAKSLKLSEVKKLRESLCTVLTRGLELGGASDNTYVDAHGDKGGYQNEFLVYGRTGEPCNKCGRELKRIVVGGRGTWVCRDCQH